MNWRQTQAKIDEIKMEFAISSSLIYFNCRYVGVDFWEQSTWYCTIGIVSLGTSRRQLGEAKRKDIWASKVLTIGHAIEIDILCVGAQE